MNIEPKILTTLMLLFLASAAFATTPADINVTEPNGDTLYSHRQITIDFNIMDPDTNQSGMTIDLNYSTSSTQGTGTVLVNDLNMSNSAITCSSSDFTTTAQCSYSFTFAQNSAPASGNYFILAAALDDDTNVTFDANGSFTFVKLNESDTLCTTVSGDLFNANGCVDDEAFENSITSAGSIAVLEGGDKADIGILLLIVILAVAVTLAVAAVIFLNINRLKNMKKS